MPAAGALLCLASAAAFGAMGIFGKLAYDEGATVGTLLATRFALAAALLWLFAACAGRARDLRALSRRDVSIALALGAVGYGAQAGGYFAALERLDASLLSLLVYTFPVIGTVTAVALGREPRSRRMAVALALASTGLVLALAGAAASVSAAGFASLAGLAVVSTVAAVALFFAGPRRVGPTAASILSTLEPLVAVALAFVAFGETLGRAQLAGGALVLLAVLAVRTPARTAATRPPIRARDRPSWYALVLPPHPRPEEETA
jgi:drug/metabolite transporter (DMT)-like permease